MIVLGNAPLMNTIPIGFLPKILLEQVSEVNTRATHPHPKATAASLVIAKAVYVFSNLFFIDL
jgi:ADP-ribosylglycohydrolase